MKTISTQQVTIIQTLLTKLNYVKGSPARDGLLLSFSSNTGTSVKNLNQQQAAELIKYLKAQDPEEAAADKMRKKVISLAHEMNWRVPGTGRADMRRIDAWCRKYSSKKKSLDNHTYAELPGLISQFERVHAAFLQKM